MANIKSQIKRNRQNEKRRVRNRTVRGSARTALANAREALTQNDPNTKESVLRAISMLDRAAQRGVLHANNAARRKGRLMKRLAALSPSAPAPEMKGAAKTAAKVEPADDKKKPKKAAAKKPAAKKPAAKKSK